ncbi:MAG: hypothetical protein LBJ18_01505 [Rickettsiales bacterium]|jgi:hypothetical protein|nr:hypothetical protein [Rickettsiales bacterium]
MRKLKSYKSRIVGNFFKLCLFGFIAVLGLNAKIKSAIANTATGFTRACTAVTNVSVSSSCKTVCAGKSGYSSTIYAGFDTGTTTKTCHCYVETACCNTGYGLYKAETTGLISTCVNGISSCFYDKAAGHDGSCCASSCGTFTLTVIAGQTIYYNRSGGACKNSSCAGYACASGYYGQPVASNSGCTACPTPGTSKIYPNNILNTQCYVMSSTNNSETSGTYQFTNDCYYS